MTNFLKIVLLASIFSFLKANIQTPQTASLSSLVNPVLQKRMFFYRIKLDIESDQGGNASKKLNEPLEEENNEENPFLDSRSPVKTQLNTYVTKIYDASRPGDNKVMISKTSRRLYGKFDDDLNFRFLRGTGVSSIVSPPPSEISENYKTAYTLEFTSPFSTCMFGINSATMHNNEEVFIRNVVNCNSGKLRLMPVPDGRDKHGVWDRENLTVSKVITNKPFLYAI